MDPLELTKTTAETAKTLVETFAIVVGGIWAYRRFIRRREDYPLINFAVDIKFVVRQDSSWIVELEATIENKGVVQQRIQEFGFDLRCLREGESISDGDEKINHQINFGTKLKTGSWLPPAWNWTFIEPGVRQVYTHIASVPAGISCVLLHGRFLYETKGDFHTAERVVAVPRQASAPERPAATSHIAVENG
jgi:hypothetical protein